MAGIEGEWHIVPDGDSTELIELAKSVDMTIMGQLQRRADGAARLRPAIADEAVGQRHGSAPPLKLALAWSDFSRSMLSFS